MAEPGAVREAIMAMVGDGAMRLDAIVDRLIADGVVQGTPEQVRDPVDEALVLDTTFATTSAGVICMPTLLEGTTWTVWVDPDDAADGYVLLSPHLDAMGWWLIGDEVEILDADGAGLAMARVEARVEGDGEVDVLVLPKHVLAFSSGKHVSITITGGSIRWAVCPTPPAVAQAHVDALRIGFERAADELSHNTLDIEDDPLPEGMRVAFGDGPIHEALLVDLPAFRSTPIATMPELYVAAGLESRGPTIAAAGSDWAAFEAWTLRRQLKYRHDLESDQVNVVTSVLEELASFATASGPSGDTSGATAAVEALGDPVVAATVWEMALERAIDPSAMAAYASSILQHSDGVDTSGAVWLLARATDRAGDALAAERMVAAQLDGGSTHTLLLLDAAAFAADRGDAPTAHQLLTAAGVELPPDADDDDEDGVGPEELDHAVVLLREVAPFTRRPLQTVGRNDRCPCGSGRKYKACHLGKERFPLEARAFWLFDKARRFLNDRGADVMWEFATAIGLDEPELVDELIESNLVADLSLHEGGVFEQFVASRAALLPEDEAALATQWLSSHRGVFEVAGIEGDAVELRNLDTDAVVLMAAGAVPGGARRGVVYAGRPVPAGEMHRAFGGLLPIAPTWVDPFVAAMGSGDADEIVGVYAQLLRPPE